MCGVPITLILASYWTTIRAAYVLPPGECMGLIPDSARAALGRLPAGLSSVAMAYSAAYTICTKATLQWQANSSITQFERRLTLYTAHSYIATQFSSKYTVTQGGSDDGSSQLGPLLFIIYLHDVPACIRPKFADDLVAVATGHNIEIVERKLQNAADELVK